jgi:hypothetical protein
MDMALIRQSTPGYLGDDGLMNARLEAVQISVTLKRDGLEHSKIRVDSDLIQLL